MCSTGRPRSRTRVRRPFSQSSLAAHPPEIPDPMTMASKVWASRPPGATSGVGRAAAAAESVGTEGSRSVAHGPADVVPGQTQALADRPRRLKVLLEGQLDDGISVEIDPVEGPSDGREVG